jgi:anti-anti-sigma factor
MSVAGRGAAVTWTGAGGADGRSIDARIRMMRWERAGRAGRPDAEQGLMNGRLSVEVEHTAAVAVLRPRGDLDLYSSHDLRGALLDCLADQPDGIVLDLSELAVVEDLALTVLTSIAQQSQRWPGARIVLAGGTTEVLAAADRMGLLRMMATCPDVPGATKELAGVVGVPRRRDRIAPDRDAPGAARAAVAQFCADYGVGAGGDDAAAQLVASELVTNAVVHAGTPIDLTLRLSRPHLHIAVRDGGDGRARLAGIMDEAAESGRGLVLVDALSQAWGNFVPTSGKVVWAVVRVRPLSPA